MSNAGTNPPKKDPADRLGPNDPPTAAAKQVFGGAISRGSAMRRSRQRAWASVPTSARWLMGIIGIVFVYSLPRIAKISWLGFAFDTKANFASLLGGTVIIYVIVALGLNVVVGLAGLLDLGYVGFYAIGAYTVAILSSKHASLPWLLCLPIAVIVAMGSGVLLGAPTLRLRGDYLAIVTLGFGEIIRLLAQKFDWLGAANGITNIPFPPSVGPLKFGALNVNGFYYLGLTLVIIVYFFLHRLENSRVGRAWTAIREDEDAAELMGVPTFKFKLWAFAIGAAVGSIAGTLYATKTQFINPYNFDLRLSILFLAAVVLGGPGNMPGVILGAVAVSYLPERLRFLDTSRYFWFGVLLVVLMIFRPQGLWPRRQVAREMMQTPDGPVALDEEIHDAGLTEDNIGGGQGIPRA